jgi:site-specific recombinase XerD
MHDVAAGKSARHKPTGRKRGCRMYEAALAPPAGRLVCWGIFSYAVKHRIREDNPVRGVVRPADGRRERRLSDEEYATFGVALRQAEEKEIWPPALKAMKFLAFTGWRGSEALTLRWDDISLAKRTAILSMTKSGRSSVPFRCKLLTSCEIHRESGKAGLCPHRAGTA